MMRRTNLAIPGLFAMILIIFLIAWVQTVSSAPPQTEAVLQDCGSCHSMADEVESWRHSSHRDVACVDCHSEPGLKGWVHIQTARLRMVLAARQGGEAGVAAVAQVPNQRCLDCHAEQMPWVMEDLEPPDLAAARAGADLPRDELVPLSAVAAHDRHLTLPQPLDCTDCHDGVAHGPAAGPDRRDAFHQTCQSCHEAQEVHLTVNEPVLCAACHMDLEAVQPADHRSPDWREVHGDQARAATAECAACHLMPDQLAAAEKAEGRPVHRSLFDPTLFPLASPGTENSCRSCHGLPMPHPEEWMADHPAQYQQQPGTCLGCHGADPGTAAAGAAAEVATNPAAMNLPNTGECAACHQVAVPHAAEYLARHGEEALRQPDACATCHTPANPARPEANHARLQFCTDCHAGVSMPHPAGFLEQHGSQARAHPDACAACHSPANPAAPAAEHARADFCADCHAGVPMPHPPAYVVRHGEAAQEDAAACSTCHSPANSISPDAIYAQPGFCSDCHGGEPMPHPESYEQSHAEAARANQVACSRCHSAANPIRPTAAHADGGYCLDCHLEEYDHPEGWVADHGPALVAAGLLPSGLEEGTVAVPAASPTAGAAARAAWSPPEPPADCALCHTAAVNSCADCHQGPEWHPDPYWFIKHRSVATGFPDPTCARCHGEVDPTCAACHRVRVAPAGTRLVYSDSDEGR